MTPEQIEELGPAFADYLQQFLFCCDYTQTFALLGVYCRGLLSALPRTPCEPIALPRRQRRQPRLPTAPGLAPGAQRRRGAQALPLLRPPAAARAEGQPGRR